MIIIFYDSDKEEVCICSERHKMKKVSINDPDIMAHIPNDDIMYVQNAHYITKNQFSQWLEGSMELNNDFPKKEINEETESQTQPDTDRKKNQKWLHPKHHGSIVIVDLKTPKWPNGVEFHGKYDFKSVEELGGFDFLEESSMYRFALAKGKIEIVSYDYVKKNFKKKGSTSLADAALDAIIVQDGRAEDVAASGGIQYGTGTMEMLIEE